jgi:uncharacterized protein YuzE
MSRLAVTVSRSMSRLVPSAGPPRAAMSPNSFASWMSYDPGTDGAYILFIDGHPGEAAVTLIDVAARRDGTPPEPIEAVLSDLTLEFDGEGRLIAIEVEHASCVLPEAFLQKMRGGGWRPQAPK